MLPPTLPGRVATWGGERERGSYQLVPTWDNKLMSLVLLLLHRRETKEYFHLRA